MPVGLFQPAQNPAPNPAGFASAAASAFGDQLRFVTAMRAAAQQQQQHAQQLQQEGFKNLLDILSKGGQPALTETKDPSTGLVRRDVNPDAVGETVTEPITGKQYRIPGKPTATPKQTFDDTMTLMEKLDARPIDSGGYVDVDQATPRFNAQGEQMGYGAHVPATTLDSSSFVTPPGGKAMYVPPQEERAAVATRQKAAAAQATAEDRAADLSPELKAAWEQRLGLPAGALKDLKVPRSSLHAFVTGLVEKPTAEDKYTHGHFVDDNGKVTLTRVGPGNAPPEMWNGKSWVSMPAGAVVGPKRKDPDAPRTMTPGQEGVQGRFNQREIDTSIAKHEALQDKEQEQWDLKQRYADAANSTDKTVIDPKTGKEEVLSDGRRKAYAALARSAEAKAMQYQGDAKRIRQRFGWGEFGQQPGAAAPAATADKKPAPTTAAPAQKKTASIDQVRAYVTAKHQSNPKFSEADGIRDFMDSGYTVTRPR